MLTSKISILQLGDERNIENMEKKLENCKFNHKVCEEFNIK